MPIEDCEIHKAREDLCKQIKILISVSEMLDSGFRGKDIAERLGIKMSYAHSLSRDINKSIDIKKKIYSHPIITGVRIADNVSVYDVFWPTRLENCFRNYSIKTVGQARAITDEDYLRFGNFGKKSVANLRAVIGY